MLRLLVTLEGEVVRDIKPIIGYVHTGIEKTAEDKSYWKVIPVVERMDYLAYYFNAMAFCGAVETLLDVEVPHARAVPARDPPRAQPDHVPPRLARDRARSTSARSRCSGTASASASRSSTCSRCPPASACTRATSRSAASSRTSRAGWAAKVREFIEDMPDRVDQYARPARQERDRPRSACATSAPLDEQTLLDLGVTGPLLRAAGNPWDLRKAEPVLAPTRTSTSRSRSARVGDNYDRYARAPGRDVRVACKIIEQALDGLPEGPYITDDRKVALPPRHELATSMEALIHHFKLVTEGFRVPPGEVYYPIEGPRGELGCFVRSDGSSQARARAHARPELRQPAGDRADGRGRLHRRPDRDAGDARPDPRRDRPLMAIDPTVPRFAHGSRVPGWDDAVDLDEGPGGGPRPGDDAGARRRCAREIEATWPSTPTAARPRSRRCTPPSAARLVLARGDRAGRRASCA